VHPYQVSIFGLLGPARSSRPKSHQGICSGNVSLGLGLGKRHRSGTDCPDTHFYPRSLCGLES